MQIYLPDDRYHFQPSIKKQRRDAEGFIYTVINTYP